MSLVKMDPPDEKDAQNEAKNPQTIVGIENHHESAPDIGLTNREVQLLKRPDIAEVEAALKKLDAILDKEENYNSKTPFATLTETSTQKSFVHIVMKKFRAGQTSAYKPAMKIILSHLEEKSKETTTKRKLITDLLNMQDSKYKRTVLHEASEQWGNEVVERLLDLGANITLSDNLGDLAVTEINPDVLEKVLDQKWTPEERDPIKDNDHDKEYKIGFDFQFLQSPNDEDNKMKPLVKLSQSKRHRHLLTHPVITTYLDQEWKKMSVWYNRNTIFTFITCLVLNLFILSNYVVPLNSNHVLTNPNSNDSNHSCNTSHILSWDFLGGSYMGWMNVCRWVLLVFIVLLLVREILQFIMAIKNKEIIEHLKDIENWVEAFFIISSMVLIMYSFGPIYKCKEMRALAATILLISWILLFNMVARNPIFYKQNVHITMFVKVTLKFIKIFVVFTPYIIAFGLFFYISMHKDNEKEIANPAIEEEKLFSVEENYELMKETKQEVLKEIDKKGEFFDNVGFSVLKALTMFVGELEFSDIPFDNIPYFSHIFFVLFVFFIVIVLMNLLTGIACDEISEIQKNAEVSSQVMRVKVMAQIEKFCLLHSFRSKKAGEEKDKDNWPIAVNDPCKCFFVCTCGSKNYWRKKLLIAVKKREQEEEEKRKQEKIEQLQEKMEIIMTALMEEREKQAKKECNGE